MIFIALVTSYGIRRELWFKIDSYIKLKKLIEDYNDKKIEAKQEKNHIDEIKKEIKLIEKEIEEILSKMDILYNELSPYIQQLPEVEAVKGKYLSKHIKRK